MEQTTHMENASEAAIRPSVVEQFSIDGLFGYRSISLSSNFAATILIARNGSGKTTLIAALDAFLRGQFTRFSGLEFKSITCKLQGVDEPLLLLREDIDQLIDLAADSELILRAKTWDIEPLALLELIESIDFESKYSDLYGNPAFYSIYAKSGYEINAVKMQFERISSVLRGRCPKIEVLRKVLKDALNDTEIVYLPTYRRIELSIPEVDSNKGERRKSILSRLGVARSGLYTADIQFGLSDISERLRSLHLEMIRQSNQGYGKISENVINDLISGDYKKDDAAALDLPSKESLEVFFSRIKNSERNYRRTLYGPYSNFSTIPNLDAVYNGEISSDAKPFLKYFLGQLGNVIRETLGTEELVSAFIDSCNRYLSGEDESTDQLAENIEYAFDTKKLKFNRQNLEVKVTSSLTDEEVPLESLSSGEKQMISLFARLYLYPGKKIVLIDEPELSLSLGWQRQILPDVLKAPNCRQVIAITHSPFIFDNELEPFAGSLKSRSLRRKIDVSISASDGGGSDE